VQVRVDLFANVARYLPPDSRGTTALVDVPEGITLGELVARLRIPPELPRLTLVNGRESEPGQPLMPGDVVSILPPLEGG
jgi:molybdopterin converting factor small subunit